MKPEMVALRIWSERASSCVLSFIRDVKSASVFSIFLSIQKSDYLRNQCLQHYSFLVKWMMIKYRLLPQGVLKL
jgi:hypothetical protein